MNIDSMEQLNSKMLLNGLEMKQKVIEIILNKQTMRKCGSIDDAFTKGVYCEPITYTNHSKSKMISNNLLDAINNNTGKVIGTRAPGEAWEYEYEGHCFTAKQIPAIDSNSLNEIKSDNNVIDFGKNKYFKYVSNDGQTHCLYTNDKGVVPIFSEHLRGAPFDEDMQKYAGFWRDMMSDPTYLYLWYSPNEVRDYMENANIKTGFFTVKMGDSEATQFYSDTTKECCIQSKQKYDVHYQSIASWGQLLKDFEPGDKFKIGGKQYILSDNHTLNIPYGEDIYDIEYPSNYKFGKKIT